MFQRQEIEAYRSITAPSEMKERIRWSIEKQRRKAIRKGAAWVSAAACLAMVVMAGGFLQGTGTIVSVNDVAVSYRALELEDAGVYGAVSASRARSTEPQIQIPLEINVTKEAYIHVSRGTLQKAVETEPADIGSELEVTEDTLVYWTVTGDTESMPTCTITEDGKEYTYVITYEEDASVFTIRQTKQ